MTRIRLDAAIAATIALGLYELREVPAALEDPLPSDSIQPITYNTFRKIRRGMAREVVVRLLGEPTHSHIGKCGRIYEYASWEAKDCEIHVDLVVDSWRPKEREGTPGKVFGIEVEAATVSAKRFLRVETTGLDRVRGWLSLYP